MSNKDEKSQGQFDGRVVQTKVESQRVDPTPSVTGGLSGISTLDPSIFGLNSAISSGAIDAINAAKAYGIDSTVGRTSELANALLGRPYGLDSALRSIGSIDTDAISRLLGRSTGFLESPEQGQVRKQRDQLLNDLAKAQEEIKEISKNKKVQADKIESYKKDLAAYEKQSRLTYLLDRVERNAHAKILSDQEFASKFDSGRKSDAYVISIDIRRSTELMLKASSPDDFATFISTVSDELSRIMKEELCVVDKFTGDGMLGYLPDFYSGSDFGLRALKVATRCHAAFSEIYAGNHSLFDTVLLDTGLGIGIDFGNVQLMRVSDGLTVIGRPVVYACRLSGAPAGKTYVNQKAFNQFEKTYPNIARFELRQYEIKNEGRVAVYELSELKEMVPAQPEWLTRSNETV